MDDPYAELFTLFRSPSRQRCAEYALVLQAVGIRCRVEPLDDGFALMVRARDAGYARQQIELYAAENPERDRPPRFDPRHRVADGLNCASLYGLTILLLDLARRHRAFGFDWWEASYSQAGLIRAGEWWRAFTALGLHADPLHLAGNLIYGLVFGFLAGQQLGWGLAWSGLLLAGALGNGLNALIQSPAHSSIGQEGAAVGSGWATGQARTPVPTIVFHGDRDARGILRLHRCVRAEEAVQRVVGRVGHDLSRALEHAAEAVDLCWQIMNEAVMADRYTVATSLIAFGSAAAKKSGTDAETGESVQR